MFAACGGGELDNVSPDHQTLHRPGEQPVSSLLTLDQDLKKKNTRRFFFCFLFFRAIWVSSASGLHATLTGGAGLLTEELESC